MNKEHAAQWNQLENMLYHTPEKSRPPLTAKASSKSGNVRLFKFIRSNQTLDTAPKSLTSLHQTYTPDNKKSTKFTYDSGVKKSIERKSAFKPKIQIDSFHVMDTEEGTPLLDDAPQSAKIVKSQNKIRSINNTDSKESFIIRTHSNKKKFFANTETGSLNTLDRTYRPSEPICGMNENTFQTLFRRKCDDMGIVVSLETEEKFIGNIRKKSLGTKLSFLESGFGKLALEHLGIMLQGNAEVSQLILRKSMLASENFIESFSRSLAFMPNLVHLDLANNGLESAAFVTLFDTISTSNTLVSIDLSNYEPDKKNKLGAEGIAAFRQFADNNPYLQFVTLSNLMLDDESAGNIIEGLENTPNLLALDLTSNVFTGKCLEKLSEVVAKTTLVRIDLSQNKLKKEAAVNLGKLIQTQRSEDKSTREGIELILENTGLGADVNIIFASLAKGSNIKKLNFSQNVLTDIEIAHFETALSENKKMQELNLTGCKMGEINGKLLALGLKKNKGLQSLLLGENNIGDNAASLIIYSLFNVPLKTLDLSQNKLAMESAKALQDLIKRNKGISKFQLNLNNFDEPEGYILQEALFDNPNITTFNIAYSKINYNTLGVVEGIVKDNQERIQFSEVPSLKTEVSKRKVFINDEKYNIELVDELNKKKDEVKRDVKRFQDALTDLQNREKSPTFKKKEKLVMKLKKDIQEEQPKIEQINRQIRDFTAAAQLELEGFQRLIEAEITEIGRAQKRVDEKKEEIEKVKTKNDPDVKILKYEISKLVEENRFSEMYNDTLADKIKNEKQIINIKETVIHNPKISDVFLASSELARHRKKDDSPSKEATRTASDKASPADLLKAEQDDKVAKQLQYVMNRRQDRADKLIKEVKVQEMKNEKRRLRKMNSKSDNSKQELIKAKIDAKLNKMFKQDKTRMTPISENEIKD